MNSCNSVKKTMEDLVKDLRDNKTFSSITPSLAFIKAGNWRSVIRWAAQNGYAITLKEIQSFIQQHPKLLAACRQSPLLAGWNAKTLAAEVRAAK